MYPHHAIAYHQVDVFSQVPFAGNGLVVFPQSDGLATAMMQRITNEMRQFEAIFLSQDVDGALTARIFTMEEELPFAGHPILGAAVVAHAMWLAEEPNGNWQFHLPAKTVAVRTERHTAWYTATMQQGRATFGARATPDERAAVLAALNLSDADQPMAYPIQMVTTGLPYLVVPVRDGLARARIIHPRFADVLAEMGAKFVYVCDIDQREGRTWDNAGLVEDSATGSAAGPVGAYLVAYDLARAGDDILLQQGRFVGRPSALHVTVDREYFVAVRGDVVPVGTGTLRLSLLP